MTCKVCGIQYVGSTTTNFRSRFNNHRSRIKDHLKLSSENKMNDDFLYQHFHSSGHLGLSHLTIQLIDRAMGDRELRKKEGELLRTCNKICNEWDQRHSNNSNTFIINEYNLHTRSE